MRVVSWDICEHFHGMNDFGYNHESGGGRYSRSRTYTGECYLQQDNPAARCRRRGRCVVAQIRAILEDR